MTELRDYQKDISDKGVELLKRYKICYLAMEVRTGKTLTALATAYKYGAQNVLFITKKKAIDDIVKQAMDMGYELNIFVTNYESLHTVDHRFDLVICDESHGLGAFPTPSKRAKEVKRIANYTPIIFLSGTPTPESYSQIYHQLWVSSYSPFAHYKNFYAWAKDFVNLRKKYIFNRAINDYTDADKNLIDEGCKHLFLTFTQMEAGFTQMINENIYYVKMDDKTYKFADRLRIDKIVTNAKGEVVMADTAVKLMNKLHQIYSGSVIVDEPTREGRVIDYTKAQFIKEKFAGKRIAIFYKFLAELVILMETFESEDVTFDATIFQGGRCRVFLTQMVSGREGLNLSNADALVMYNIDFSATTYWQSRARIQTKDRDKEAQLYWIFSYNGIEDKIYKAVCEKKDYTISHFKKDFL
jgi:SNF2 family DNA or RNA helicase